MKKMFRYIVDFSIGALIVISPYHGDARWDWILTYAILNGLVFMIHTFIYQDYKELINETKTTTKKDRSEAARD